MGSRKHALLSASSSHRWLNCPPSARLSEEFEERVSDYAAEGTDAHSLCEYKLRKALGLNNTHPAPVLSWHSEEMEQCANEYVDFVLDLYEKAKEECADPLILIEQRLDYSKYCESGFGTGDCVIVSDNSLHVIDYKHGRGIEVDSNWNTQLMLYALGALELLEPLYEVGEVSMTVYQPRRSNISTFTLTKDELLKWAEEVLVPTAKLAFNGEGKFQSGEWCFFCKAKHTCRKRAEDNIKIAQLEFRDPPLLSDEEIEEVLLQIDDLVSWASDIKDYALQQALSGRKWSGFKVVEGRSVRKYSDETAVAEVVKAAGFNPYQKKIVGIGEMQKRLGKEQFQELLGEFLIKPDGKPTLVLSSDKRPEYITAATDFNDKGGK